jgi:hypothetical protein
VSPQEQIERSQPFSAPFRIFNAGYLSFHVDHVFFYINRVDVDDAHIIGGGAHWLAEDNFELGRGEGKTIVYQVVSSSTVPRGADVAIIVDVRPFRWLHWSVRRYFRFVGAYVDNWQWLAEPSEPIQADVNRQIEEWMRVTPATH